MLIHRPAWIRRMTSVVLLVCSLSVLGAELFSPKPSSLEDEWPNTDFSKRTVDLFEIIAGGPPKDGIPAIDQPRFIDYQAADVWLDMREPVIALRLGKRARAYPIQILIYHEIVNDQMGGTPVAITFCPLCNAALAFDRRVNGRVLDFGTTGRLRKSDLVMYDRQTESWWQQFSGQGIVGHYAGQRLKRLSVQIVAYGDFKSAYPQGEVLSRVTGYYRPYGRNPYRGYDHIDQSPFLYFDPLDKRLPPMERVISVQMGGRQRIYPFSLLTRQAVINDSLAGEPVVILSREGTFSALDKELISASRTIPSATAYSRRLGEQVLDFYSQQGRLLDRQSRSEWNLLGQAVSGPLQGNQLQALDSGVHFAFAWLAFNPDSEIYQGAEIP